MQLPLLKNEMEIQVEKKKQFGETREKKNVPFSILFCLG